MRKWKISILSLLLLLIYSLTCFAAPSIDRVSYIIRGDFNEVESLQLKLEDRIDNINSLGLLLLYDGQSFKVEGDWQIEFLKRSSYKMNLAFILPLDLSEMKLGRGLGISGESFYSSINRFSWKVSYFFDRVDPWAYEVSMLHPLHEDTALLVGIGNNSWHRDNKLFFGLRAGIYKYL